MVLKTPTLAHSDGNRDRIVVVVGGGGGGGVQCRDQCS